MAAVGLRADMLNKKRTFCLTRLTAYDVGVLAVPNYKASKLYGRRRSKAHGDGKFGPPCAVTRG
jgi:hypothetical protein